jgi:FtsZ-binding cell division protein ZapB
VASRTDIGGTATANEINRSWRTRKGRSLGRITCSTLFGPLIAAGLFVALAPVPGRADDDRDRYPGHEDRDKGIGGEIAAVQAKIASLLSTLSTLQGEVSALQKANTGLQNEVSSLQTSNTTLRSQLTAVQANNALKLGPFVSVDPDPEIGVIGPNIIFHGANIHIVSGSGATDDYGNPTGLGNLIIGYDDDPALRGTFPLTSGDRGGSHNLVIGRGNKFTKAAFGGLLTQKGGNLTHFCNPAISLWIHVWHSRLKSRE